MSAGDSMTSGYRFPVLLPAEIAEKLVEFDIAPFDNLRPEQISKPQSDLLHAVLRRFFAAFVDVSGDDEDGQLGFSDLAALDNLELYVEALAVLRFHNKSRVFLESIHLKDFTLDDLLSPSPSRVGVVLSALINFQLHRSRKLQLLQPIVNESTDWDERTLELKARIDELGKEVADNELAKQMEEPLAQQLEAEVKALEQKLRLYNKQQLSLRKQISDIDDKKEETNMKAHEKLAKLDTKIQDVQEQLKLAAAKTVEKDVKAGKAKLNNESLSVRSLDAQIVEMQGKEYEMEEHLKAKKKERNQIIADENQKLGALKYETDECKRQCLELREKKAEAMIEKASELFSEAASVRTVAKADQNKICANFNNVVKAFNTYMGDMDPILERAGEVGRQMTEDYTSAPRASARSKMSRARKRT